MLADSTNNLVLYYDRYQRDFLDLIFYQNKVGELVGIEYNNFPNRRDNPFCKIKEGCTLQKKELPEIKKEYDQYLLGRRENIHFKFLLDGTPFQLKVWNYLLTLEYGEVTSYGEIAEHIGHPRSQRAVGNAVGANPLSIIVPCHRVLNKGKKAVGHYNGGEDVKRKLLELEKVAFKE